MRTGHERAHGPYTHGKKWRVVFVDAAGHRQVESYETLEAANAEIEAARKTADNRTIGGAVRDYLESLHARKNSRDTARHRLVALLQLAEPHADRQLATLNTAVAKKLVGDRKSHVAYETLRGEIRYASQFAAWCVGKGWMTGNPFAAIKVEAPQEGRSRGKPQLRVDEVRQFLVYALAEDTPESTAVLMTLLMGLRAHEVVERTVRDLDDRGRLLVIGKSKSRAGERIVSVPLMLRERLRVMTEGKSPDTLVFGGMSRHALHYHVVRMAKAAGVPRVTPHGMRGTFSTMAITAAIPGIGVGNPHGTLTVGEVARMVGHADAGVTLRRHYLNPGAEDSAKMDAVEKFLNNEED